MPVFLSMKIFISLILVFLALHCHSEPDLSGQWFVFLEAKGGIRFRTDYDCFIKKDKTWFFVRRMDGVTTFSGSLVFAENGLYLEPQTQKKKTGDKLRQAVPVSVCSSSELRLIDPVFGSVLVFIPSQKLLPKNISLNGTWQFHQKDTESGEIRHAPFKIRLSENGVFTVSYKNEQKPDDPKKGTYEFKDGILKLIPECSTSNPFWSTPVFFFYDSRLVMNRNDVYVYGERE